MTGLAEVHPLLLWPAAVIAYAMAGAFGYGLSRSLGWWDDAGSNEGGLCFAVLGLFWPFGWTAVVAFLTVGAIIRIALVPTCRAMYHLGAGRPTTEGPTDVRDPPRGGTGMYGNEAAKRAVNQLLASGVDPEDDGLPRWTNP